ncbi:MAG: YgaP family membrane protein [Leptospirillum sp.]
MNIERMVRGFAGTFILVSLLLAHYESPNWLWLTAFVGANLLQSSLTRWCLLERILRRVLKNRSTEGSCKTA